MRERMRAISVRILMISFVPFVGRSAARLSSRWSVCDGESLAFRLRSRNQLARSTTTSDSLTASWMHCLNSANSLLHIPLVASVYFAAIHFP